MTTLGTNLIALELFRTFHCFTKTGSVKHDSILSMAKVSQVCPKLIQDQSCMTQTCPRTVKYVSNLSKVSQVCLKLVQDQPSMTQTCLMSVKHDESHQRIAKHDSDLSKVSQAWLKSSKISQAWLRLVQDQPSLTQSYPSSVKRDSNLASMYVCISKLVMRG